MLQLVNGYGYWIEEAPRPTCEIFMSTAALQVEGEVLRILHWGCMCGILCSRKTSPINLLNKRWTIFIS